MGHCSSGLVRCVSVHMCMCVHERNRDTKHRSIRVLEEAALGGRISLTPHAGDLIFGGIQC